MTKKTVPKKYYEEFLEICNSIPRTSRLPELWKTLKNEHPGKGLNLPFGTCIIDYATKKYAYLSDNSGDILTYSKEEYIAGGLDSHAVNFHPEDREIFDNQIFRDIREFWNNIPAEEIPMYRFSFNQRQFIKDGAIIQILQHSTYLEPQHSGTPALNLLTFSDISDFKSDKSMVLSVSRFVSGEGYVKVCSKTYTQSTNIPFSARESEILKLSLNGLTSQSIADKLFLSIHTVKNHKRNMMEKTATRNITELINLSIRNKWI